MLADKIIFVYYNQSESLLSPIRKDNRAVA